MIAFLEPTFALQILAVVAGAFALYFAVVELIAAVAPRASRQGEGAPHAPRRGPRTGGSRRRPGAVIVAAAVARVPDHRREEREVTRPAGPVKACNGLSAALRPHPGGGRLPGGPQRDVRGRAARLVHAQPAPGDPRQLDEGIRAFLIDSHPGIKLKGGRIVTDLNREGTGKVVEAVREQLGPGGRRAVQAADGPGQSTSQGTPGSYFCHIVCELGSTPMTKVLGWVKSFLDTHPDEVVILFIEDNVSPEQTAGAFEQSGILRYAYDHRPGQPFPTLRRMIEADKRLFVMAEEDNGGGKFPWYHAGFELAQETPYTFNSVKELADLKESCIGNRGIAANPLFQLNHWVESLPRSPATAAKVNDFEFLGAAPSNATAAAGCLPTSSPSTTTTRAMWSRSRAC